MRVCSVGGCLRPLNGRWWSSKATINSIRSIATNSPFLRISDEIREAILSKKPVVALETTIYTHGFPYPDNVALATELETIVRENGGIPATIGILDGIARVGLTSEELIRLISTAGNKSTLKLSRRDLAYACAVKSSGHPFNGGTTIAGTMVLAHLAGIKVFATGGLGGVHRGAESTMDISADLTELGRTPVAVISSGCKSFLDIPRTLEVLETQGVGVATFTDDEDGAVEFPAFWSRKSGVKSPMAVRNEREAASIIHAQSILRLSSGLHFANPIPLEAEIPKSEMDIVIEEAIRQADSAGALGKDNTPFILNKIKELSRGKSIIANRSLIQSNVKRGTLVAIELSKMESENPNDTFNRQYEITHRSRPVQRNDIQQDTGARPSFGELTTPRQKPDHPVDILVAGALAVDYSCNYAPLLGNSGSITPSMQTSNPARISQSLGGVAHNIARTIHLLGSNVRLCSAVGNDLAGRQAVNQLKLVGMDTNGVKILEPGNQTRTSQYVAVNDTKKDLVIAMADMGILEANTESLKPFLKNQLVSTKPKWLIVDANWSSEMLSFWMKAAKATGARTVFEPVSTAKAIRLLTFHGNSSNKHSSNTSSNSLPVFPDHLVDLMTPNYLELSSMHSFARSTGLFDQQDWWSTVDAMGIPSSGARTSFERGTSPELADLGIPQQSIQLLPFIPQILTKLGEKGVVLSMLLHKHDQRLRSPEAERYIIARSNLSDPDSQVGGVYLRHFPAEIVDTKDIKSVNGVGDTFLGALVVQLIRGGVNVEDAIVFAQKAAAMTLTSNESVHPAIRSLLGQDVENPSP